MRRSLPRDPQRDLQRNTLLPTRLALAAACCLAWSLYSTPAGAAIVSSGLVSPDPTSGAVPGYLNIGSTGAGNVTVNGGSTLTAGRVELGAQVNGNGSLVVTGAGSTINTTLGVVSGPVTTTYNANIGSQGKGRLEVLDGGSFRFGNGDANCQANCRVKVANGAGADGFVLVSGAGSLLTGVGTAQVGYASLFTQAGNGFVYGIPGGASKGEMQVLAGGTVQTSALDIGFKDLATSITSAETATGKVLVDGAGSSWLLTRNAAQTGSRAMINMAIQAGTEATLEIRNGGVVTLDGSSAPGQLSGINMGSAAGGNAANSQATLRVAGAGSRLEFGGGTGFFNLGRGNGSVATVTVADGGALTSTSANGLAFMSVGRGGGNGTLDVTGAGSLVRLTGRNPADGGGAFLNIGRSDVTAGTGTVNIRNGGRFEIDTLGQVLANGSAQPGAMVGIGAGSSGTLNVMGANSVLSIAGDSGVTPFFGIGRDGSTGAVTVSSGGRIEISSSHLSVPAPGSSYLSGDGNFLNIGQRNAGSDGLLSSGSLTITGANSALQMSGTADRLVQVGLGANSSGSVNLLAGGSLSTSVLLLGIGNTASGNLLLSGGHLLLEGERKGGPVAAAGGGGGMSVGRNGGTGTVTVANGSTLTVNTAAGGGGIGIGGSEIAAGGTATMVVSGGSTVSVNGPSVALTVGGASSATAAGIGTLSLSGSGTTVAVNGAGARVMVGYDAGSIGTLSVGAGARLSSQGLIGVAHNGTASTGATGLLVVNGIASAAQLVVGSTGLLAGSGTVQAAVTNQGVINPGNSPGRLTIDGAFDNRDGKIVLEVQSLAGGGFAVDELVFTDWSQVVMGDGEIEFRFLGDTNPEDFLDAGLFTLGTFFKAVDAAGGVVDLAGADKVLFSGSAFTASAAQFRFTQFSFDPDGGATLAVAAVPLPAPLLMVLLGVGLLAWQRRRLPARVAAASAR